MIAKQVFRSGKHGILFPVLLIAALTLAVYANTLRNSFVYDDHDVIEHSRLIRIWANLPALFNHDYFLLSGEMSYRPVVTFSYLVDYSFWKLNPFGYHLGNLLIHALNGVLIFLIFRSLPIRPAAALAAALLFVVHPVTAEPVNAVGFREELLAAFFCLLAYSGYLNLLQETRHRKFFLFFTSFSFLLALFTKEVAIVLPLLLPATESLFGRNAARSVRQQRPLYFVLFLVLVFYLLVRFAVFGNPRQHFIVSAPLYSRIISIGMLFAVYLKLMLIPVTLSAEHTFPFVLSFTDLKFILPEAGLTALIVFSFWKRRRFPGPVFAFWWVLLFLAPVANIYPLYNPAAERYLYLPLVGFCLGLVLVAEAVFLSLKSPPKYLFPGLLFLLVLFFSVRTVNRNRDWRDSSTFCRKTLLACPGSARFHNNLGTIYQQSGRLDKAAEEFQAALKIDPEYALANYNLGVVFEARGRLEEAEAEYLRALEIDPGYAAGRNNLGGVYQKRGRLKEAAGEFSAAIKLNPFDEKPHYNLALVYETQGLTEKAVAEYRSAIKINPDYASARNNLGVVYLKQGLIDRAIEELRAAVKADPRHAGAHYNLGLAYKSGGRLAEARRELETAIEINPESAPAHNGLAMILAETGEYAGAKAHWKRALALNPALAEAKSNLDKLERMKESFPEPGR